MKTHIAIYSRKSKFTGKGESIENQIEMCRNYISLKYGASAAENILVYEDEGFSGGNLDRPRFKAMMEDIKGKNIRAVVCYRLDRISRNIGDFARLVEIFETDNVDFISVKEQFDLSSPMGRAMMYISSIFSQLERETIAERIKDNLYELAKTGRWLGGITPTGYESESVEAITLDGKKRKSHKLKIVQDEAELVKKIFEIFLLTQSLTETNAYLLQNGIKSKNEKNFSRFTIKGILTNPVYLMAGEAAYDYFSGNNADIFSKKEDFTGKNGIMAYNRTLQKKGKTHRIKPISEWIVTIGEHEGLISSADWLKAQSILDINRSKNYHKPRSNVALLSGILKCGDCGDYLRPKLSGRGNKAGEQVYDYICNMKERSKKSACDMKNINGNRLDKLVCGEIKKLEPDSVEFIKELKKVRAKLAENKDDYNTIMKKCENNLAENESKIKKLVNILTESPDESIRQRIFDEINELNEKSAILKSKISETRQLTQSQPPTGIEFEPIGDLLKSFAKTMDTMSVVQQREAIRTLVKQVVWDGDEVHIYLFGSDAPENLPMPNEIKAGGDIFGTNKLPSGEYSK